MKQVANNLGNYDHNCDIHYANAASPFISRRALFAKLSDHGRRSLGKKPATDEIHLPISFGSNGIAINRGIFAIKIFPASTAAIKKDLLLGSSLIAIFRVSLTNCRERGIKPICESFGSVCKIIAKGFERMRNNFHKTLSLLRLQLSITV